MLLLRLIPLCLFGMLAQAVHIQNLDEDTDMGENHGEVVNALDASSSRALVNPTPEEYSMAMEAHHRRPNVIMSSSKRLKKTEDKSDDDEGGGVSSGEDDEAALDKYMDYIGRRQLINLNKLNLGNLVALRMLMKSRRYHQAHVVFNGLQDQRGAAGHFYDFVEQFDFSRSFYPNLGFSPYVTYAGRDAPKGGEWYEKEFEGQPTDPDFPDIEHLLVKSGITYDIHQVAPTSLRDHRFLHSHILKNGGKIGTIYLQHGHNTKVVENDLLSGIFPKLVHDIYGKDCEKILVIHSKSLDTREISVRTETVLGRFPFLHIMAATRDPFMARTLLIVNEMLSGSKTAPLEFLPPRWKDHIEKLPEKEGIGWDLVHARRFISRAIWHSWSDVCGHLRAWIPEAQTKLKKMAKEEKDEKRRRAMLVQAGRLDFIMNKINAEPKPEGEVEFADPMFTAVVLSPDKYQSKPWQPEDAEAAGEYDKKEISDGEGEASSSKSEVAGTHSDDHAAGKELAIVPYNHPPILSFENLPREELLEKVFEFFPKEVFFYRGQRSSPHDSSNERVRHRRPRRRPRPKSRYRSMTRIHPLPSWRSLSLPASSSGEFPSTELTLGPAPPPGQSSPSSPPPLQSPFRRRPRKGSKSLSPPKRYVRSPSPPTFGDEDAMPEET